MKKRLMILVTIVALLINSCKVVGTLYPISQNVNDFIFINEMIGKWGDLEDSSQYCLIDTTSGEEGKEYLIETVFRNNEKHTIESTRFKAFIINIEGSYYIDCAYNIEQGLPSDNHPLQDLLIPRHFIFRLSFPEKNTIEFESPDTDEMIKLIDRKKLSLHYSTLEKDNYLIIDKPEILQKEIAKSKKYPELFKEKNILKKLD